MNRLCSCVQSGRCCLFQAPPEPRRSSATVRIIARLMDDPWNFELLSDIRRYDDLAGLRIRKLVSIR